MTQLNWRTLTSANDVRFFVKGTEIASALVPGFLSRFLLVEVRTLTIDREPDRAIVIRDAHLISDAEIAKGKRAPIAKWCETEAEAIAWCESQR